MSLQDIIESNENAGHFYAADVVKQASAHFPWVNPDEVDTAKLLATGKTDIRGGYIYYDEANNVAGGYSEVGTETGRFNTPIDSNKK